MCVVFFSIKCFLTLLSNIPQDELTQIYCFILCCLHPKTNWRGPSKHDWLCSLTGYHLKVVGVVITYSVSPSRCSNTSPPIVSLSGFKQISIILYAAFCPQSLSFLALLKCRRASFGSPVYLAKELKLTPCGKGFFLKKIF